MQRQRQLRTIAVNDQTVEAAPDPTMTPTETFGEEHDTTPLLVQQPAAQYSSAPHPWPAALASSSSMPDSYPALLGASQDALVPAPVFLTPAVPDFAVNDYGDTYEFQDLCSMLAMSMGDMQLTYTPVSGAHGGSPGPMDQAFGLQYPQDLSLGWFDDATNEGFDQAAMGTVNEPFPPFFFHFS